MGVNKPNAYTLFVREEFRRRQRAGQQVNFTSLFKELDSKWRSLPEEVRLKYKDEAKNGGPSSSSGPTQDFLCQPKQGSQQEKLFNDYKGKKGQSQLPSCSIYTDNESISMLRDVADIKPNPTELKRLADDRGVKREHTSSFELKLYENERECQIKRTKLGFAVPNWRNITKSDTPDADRYCDYNLVRLRNQTDSIIANRGENAIKIPMCTFSCNVLCMHKKGDEEIYIPIEIGMYNYSIEKGLIEIYHVLIDAGPVPSGYYGDAVKHAESNHRIKFGASGYPEHARKDYRAIYKEMTKFTKSGERTILIADSRDYNQVQGSIKWLYEKASASDKSLPRPTTWTILPLVEFVAGVSNFVWQKMLYKPERRFIIHYMLKYKLENSTWDYEARFMCDYHANLPNVTKSCAKCCAIRAINCIEDKLEETYKLYKAALELREVRNRQPNAEAPLLPVCEPQQLQQQLQRQQQQQSHQPTNDQIRSSGVVAIRTETMTRDK